MPGEGRVACAAQEEGPVIHAVRRRLTPTALTALLTRTEYVVPQPDACWLQILVQNDAEFAGFSQGNWQAFTPGQHVTANWTAQPSRPG